MNNKKKLVNVGTPGHIDHGKKPQVSYVGLTTRELLRIAEPETELEKHLAKALEEELYGGY